MSATTAFRHILLATTALVALVPMPHALAQTLPTGGSVAAGNVTITRTAPTALRLDQSSATAITNWQSFSIGAGARVEVVQPSAQAAMLARVTGATPSTIAGSLTATGQLMLVNPNGIAIGPTGTVAAGGGFVASSLTIADGDFLSGKWRFSGNGGSATVANAGTVTVGSGGYVALIGGSIDQSGTISVPLGRVGLGSGEQATLDLSGDGFLQVGVPTGSAGSRALVEMSGTIRANGGRVEIKAAAAREAARHAINLSGVVEARSVSGRSGDIVLGGSGGRVSVSGRLDASSRRAKGGSVTITGRDVALKGATVDARGATGGGIVRIGGDRQGKGTLARAETTTIDAASRIDASATRAGDGGSVVVWSDGATSFAGTIVATGGPRSGNGGEAEVSGKGVLAYTGFTDLSAPHGAFGTLLLDPYNVRISHLADATSSGFTASANDSIIDATTLQTALGSANVTVSTGSGGTQAGDIDVIAPITWSAGTTLTLAAAGSIDIGHDITATGAGAGLVLQYGSGGGYSIVGGTVTLTGAGATLAIGPAGGLQSYTLVQSLADLAALPASGTFALARDLDTGTTPWTPIASFGGTFAGLAHTVTLGSVTTAQWGNAGLFGTISASGSVRDLGVAGAVTGTGYVGGLAGLNYGTLHNVWSDATVTGDGDVGGLVGGNMGGMIVGSWTTGPVSATGSEIGGLVGYNSGTITGSHAYGAVTGGYSVGGLVGTDRGTIIASGAWGNVTGSTRVGGLIGNAIYDTVAKSHAMGRVTVTSSEGDGGGLVADAQHADISDVYATGWVVGGYMVGGLIGYEEYSSVARAYALGLALPESPVGYAGGILGQSRGGSLTDVYYADRSTSSPATPTNVEHPGMGGWMSVPTMTRLQLLENGTLTFADLSAYFDKTNTWTADGEGKPILRAEQSQYLGNAHQMSLIGNAPGRNYVVVNDFDFHSGSQSPPIFTGQLSGRGHSITIRAKALFQSVDGGGIRNLTVSGSGDRALVAVTSNKALFDTISVRGTMSAGDGDVGGIVGNGVDTAIVHSTADVGGGVSGSLGGLAGTLTGLVFDSTAKVNFYLSSTAGGLVGSMTGTISESSASGTIQAGWAGGLTALLIGSVDHSTWNGSLSGRVVGGLVAETNSYVNSYITASSAKGSISGVDNSWASGGLVGLGDVVNITGSKWEGDISGITGVGGLVGSARDVAISASSVSGSVSGSERVGGIVGSGSLTRIVGSTAAATVTGITDVGGLVGLAENSAIVNSRSVGTVNGVTNVGGLAGRMVIDSFISKSVSTATVSGTTAVGGLAGTMESEFEALASSIRFWNRTSIDASYATGSITGTTAVGGLVGRLASGSTVTGSWSSGRVSGTTSVGGLVGEAGAPVEDLLDNVHPESAGTIVSSYWATDKSGTAAAVGSGPVGEAVGLTIAQFQDTTGFMARATAAGWNFDTTWAPSAIGAMPALYETDPVVWVKTATVSSVYGDATGTASASTAVGGPATYVNGGSATLALTGATVAVDATVGVGTGGTGVLPVQVTTATASDGTAYRVVWYGSETATVTARPITVTATAASRVYGDADPAPTWTVGGRGLVNGDTLTGALATAATATSHVGSYAITRGTLAASANYAVTYVGASLAVTARPITITATATSRVYGDADPAFGWTVGGRGLVNGDVLTGALATSATATSHVGTHAVTRGTLAASSDYSVTAFTGAALTVTARPITITATAASRVYGDADPALGWTVGGRGLVNGDTLTGALATSATATSHVGTHAVTRGTLAASSDYSVTSFTGAALTVTARPITITANAASRIYGDADPALTWTVGGRGLANGDTLTGAPTTAATTTSHIGSYAIGRGALTASNDYSVTSFTGASLTVTARPITVTAVSLTRAYGTANPALTWVIGGRGLIAGDSPTGSLTTAATAVSPVGTYAIERGTLAASNDYATTFTPGVLTVEIVRTVASTGHAVAPTSPIGLVGAVGRFASALPWTSDGNGYTQPTVCFGSATQCIDRSSW